METRQGVWQPLVIAGETPKASEPSDGSLNHPAPGQEDKTVFGIGQLDNLQLDTLRGGIRRGLFASVALVNEGDLYRAAGHCLHLLG